MNLPVQYQQYYFFNIVTTLHTTKKCRDNYRITNQLHYETQDVSSAVHRYLARNNANGYYG